MALIVYTLCAMTSLLVAILLYRDFHRKKLKLLFWSSWGFAGFALNNILLAIDFLIPNYDLSIIRTLPALIGMIILIFGLISETSTGK